MHLFEKNFVWFLDTNIPTSYDITKNKVLSSIYSKWQNSGLKTEGHVYFFVFFIHPANRSINYVLREKCFGVLNADQLFQLNIFEIIVSMLFVYIKKLIFCFGAMFIIYNNVENVVEIYWNKIRKFKCTRKHR